MRTIVVARLLFAVPIAALLQGCGAGDCENLGTCGPFMPYDAASDGAGAAGSTGAGGGSAGAAGDQSVGGAAGAGGGGVDADASVACDPKSAPSKDPCVVDDKYGVFVSPMGNDASGTGTRSAPYKTIGKGLTQAHGKNIYTCAGNYAESLTIDMNVDSAKLYGGFDCGTWSYDAANRPVVKPASGIPLTVKGLATGVTIEDVEFDAPDATTPGASSFGALVDSSMNVTLRRVKVVAGKGAIGQGGTDGAKGTDGATSTATQKGTDAACGGGAPGSQVGGSWPDISSCGSLGGVGGAANKNGNGAAGDNGQPTTDLASASLGSGGPAQTSLGMDGNSGQPGSDGLSGSAGTVGSTLGLFSQAGYSASVPGAGTTDGHAGQGGGGGSGSRAAAGCIGASGGAGGMGGCGGKSGTSGGGGGASVALLSWTNVGLNLDGCEFVARDGGMGGKGGNGGPGGFGQDGAPGGATEAADGGSTMGKGGHGGKGGNGGNGGSGAGGNGGPSYALVYKGTKPSEMNTMLTPGAIGAKEVGGSAGAVQAPDGNPGQAGAEFSVP